MRTRGQSIVTRIVGSLFLFSLLITGMAGFFATRQVSASLSQSIQDRLTVAVGMKEVELRRMVEKQKALVEIFSRLPDVRRQARILVSRPGTRERAAARAALAGLLAAPSLQQLGWREVLVLGSHAGKVEFATEAGHEGDFRYDDRFFLQGLRATSVQNVYPWPVTLQPTLTIATPLADDRGATLAVLAVHLNLDRMDEIVSGGIGLGKSGETYLIDRYNSFVSSQRFGRHDFPRGAHTDGIDAAVQGRSGSGRYLNYRGTPVVGVYRWLPDLDLAMIAEVAQAEALAPARRLGMAVAGIGLAGAALLMVGIYFLARRIARPILAIKDTAVAVADGDLDAVAPILSSDEVGVLARAFNEMTARLRNAQNDLERQVAARTAELRGALVAAQQASRAKSAFVSAMSHELRTPLNAILGYAQLMGMGTGRSDPAEFPGFASKILVAGEHLLALINDVLSVARIEENRVDLAAAPFALRELALGVEGMLLVRARSKDLALVVTVDPALPGGILGDEGRLRQVLLNLVGNAVKFTRKGRVELKLLATAEGRLRVEVADTGPGIAPEELPRLFNSFVQAETGRRAKEGAGLGLYLSQSFVRLMGGEIRVVSELGKGTLFSFELPMTASDPPVASALLRRSYRLEPGQALPTQLVVDDLEDNREVLATFLASLGLTVRTARDGREAVAIWEQWRPGVVWMDMHMPVEDGFSATQRIRSRERAEGSARTPILAISASVFDKDQISILEAGCDALVTKPYREADIVAALGRHAGLRFIEAAGPGPAAAGSLAEAGALPAGWRRGMREALGKGDLDAARAKVLELPETAAGLRGTLLELLAEFRLDELERLLPMPAEDA
jgi:signal transduction histidine kinase/ActR/RegA family two-component response regulator